MAHYWAASQVFHECVGAKLTWSQLSVDAHGGPKYPQWVYTRRDIREGTTGKFECVNV